MLDHTGRQPKQTTKRARKAAAQDAALSPRTAFKLRPRLDADQSGKRDGAKLVHRVRVLKRWTQERLAAELGVSQDTISNWERDRCRPPNLAIVVMKSLLDVA